MEDKIITIDDIKDRICFCAKKTAKPWMYYRYNPGGSMDEYNGRLYGAEWDNVYHKVELTETHIIIPVMLNQTISVPFSDLKPYNKNDWK